MDTQVNHYITGDPAFAVDQLGGIVFWNNAAEKTFHVPADQALGQKCWRLLCGTDKNGNRYCGRRCPLREMAFRHEPVNSFQASFRTAANKNKPFDVSCLTVFDEPGNEMLLHICRPGNKYINADHTHSAWTPANEDGDTLSEREAEVLRLLADGVRTKDIAATLSISIRTVRTHIQHLMYKLQVHKRAEAVKEGKRLKFI